MGLLGCSSIVKSRKMRAEMCYHANKPQKRGSEVKASASNAGGLGLILGREDPLEKEMATHSSTLAWRIPWMEEPDGLQSMGSQRVGHD